MKNEPNIEQIVLNPSRTPYNSQLMENLKFSQMTFPIFPHFANDFEQAWEILSHRSTLTEHKNFPKASFLVIYFWITVRSMKCIHFQDFFAIIPIFLKLKSMKSPIYYTSNAPRTQKQIANSSPLQIKSIWKLTQNAELRKRKKCYFLPGLSLA